MAYKYSNYFTVTEAGTYEPNGPSQAIRGQVVGFAATITALPVTGDIWRFIKVPKGAKMLYLACTNASLGTDCPGTLGWESADAGAFSTDVVWETANTLASISDTANAATRLRVNTAGVTAAEDYLSCTIGTVNTGASGAVTITGAYLVP